MGGDTKNELRRVNDRHQPGGKEGDCNGQDTIPAMRKTGGALIRCKRACRGPPAASTRTTYVARNVTELSVKRLAPGVGLQSVARLAQGIGFGSALTRERRLAYFLALAADESPRDPGRTRSSWLQPAQLRRLYDLGRGMDWVDETPQRAQRQLNVGAGVERSSTHASPSTPHAPPADHERMRNPPPTHAGGRRPPRRSHCTQLAVRGCAGRDKTDAAREVGVRHGGVGIGRFGFG
ncbi:hypothetical protein B0H10DRAFT_1964742 [Mycena sp. CBHHK59/15]|nr:hypothetical protein B0H10DRAFT_1964742 [Mycena sp. CBHHK59/15]